MRRYLLPLALLSTLTACTDDPNAVTFGEARLRRQLVQCGGDLECRTRTEDAIALHRARRAALVRAGTAY